MINNYRPVSVLPIVSKIIEKHVTVDIPEICFVTKSTDIFGILKEPYGISCSTSGSLSSKFCLNYVQYYRKSN
jgi:hypothetical protein